MQDSSQQLIAPGLGLLQTIQEYLPTPELIAAQVATTKGTIKKLGDDFPALFKKN